MQLPEPAVLIAEHVENLYNNQTYGSQTHIFQAIQEALGKDVIILYVHGKNVQSAINNIQLAFTKDEDDPPLNKWYPKHKKHHFLQIGDYASSTE